MINVAHYMLYFCTHGFFLFDLSSFGELVWVYLKNLFGIPLKFSPQPVIPARGASSVSWWSCSGEVMRACAPVSETCEAKARLILFSFQKNHCY